MKLLSIDEIDIKEKRVFIRTDFNVPLDREREVIDDARIVAALPTIRYAVKEKARVIIASHLGRPMGKSNPKLTLEPVGRRLSELLDCEIFFPEDCIGDAVKKLAGDMFPGSVMLLENLRFQTGEEEDDPGFARRLAQAMDVYVNEAFSVSHRAHASVSAILDYVETACVGFQFKKEVENLNRLIQNPTHPFVSVMGGRKASEKIPIMESMLDKADTFLIGGAISNTFLKVLGKEVGKSSVDRMSLYMAEKLISSATSRNIRFITPKDALLIKGDLNNYSDSFIISTGVFPGDTMAVDIGPATIQDFTSRISRAKTVFWNGPVGVCENSDFEKGNARIAEAVAESGAFSVAAGWDTVSVIEKSGFSHGFSHLSAGGKAALEFIQGKPLPALLAFQRKSK